VTFLPTFYVEDKKQVELPCWQLETRTSCDEKGKVSLGDEAEGYFCSGA